jgi:hypothetical protein
MAEPEIKTRRCPTCDAWSCSCAKETAPARLIGFCPDGLRKDARFWREQAAQYRFQAEACRKQAEEMMHVAATNDAQAVRLEALADAHP